ncbi:MAG TPA: hypothetical protein VFN62_14225 [Acidobacteriaceae bacterium]|nr:hypothetical protein [Acidobacteriaceae bacterium]
MQNAHLRLGRLEYRRSTEKTDTRISVHVDRYVGEEKDAHLISVFGGDAEVGAITAAVYEKHTFTLTFPNGSQKAVGFGPDAVCYRGSINLQGRKQALRQLIAVSTSLHANGTAGRTFILHLAPDTREPAWATLVSFLGLPADPRWSGPILEAMWAEKKIHLFDGIGCAPAVVHGTRDELLARIGRARSLGYLPFPEKNGPVLWPRYTIRQALKASSVASTSDA